MNLPRLNVLPLSNTPVSFPLAAAFRTQSLLKARRVSNVRFGGKGGEGDTFSITRSVTDLSSQAGSQLEEPHGARLERLQAYAERAARLIPNYSGRHYGALVVLADGTEGLGVNVEASRQVTLCDLRLALSLAQNRWVEKQTGSAKPPPTLPAVQSIYLVNADVDGDQPIPCADCQEWLASPLCPPETEVISLEKNPQDQKQSMVRRRTVREMLPLYKARPRMGYTTSEPLSGLPVVYSSSALQVAALLPDSEVRTLLEKAKKAYRAGQSLAKESRLETGAAALLSPSGIISTGNRVDWSTRWHEPADLSSASQGFVLARYLNSSAAKSMLGQWLPAWLGGGVRQITEPQRIRAVAYYGDDPTLPPIASLGRIARKKGSPQTLILTIESDQIQVRTIRDFLPEVYRAN